MIQNSLEAVINSHDGEASIDEISTILRESIITLDNQIGDEFLSLFSSGKAMNVEEIAQRIESMSVEEIKQIINDHDSGGTNHSIVTRVMRGTTALIGLMDPAKENLWIANLGDCQASE